MTDFAYTVSAQAHYDAAHFLRNYEGKCSRLHGHRYVVEAALQAAEQRRLVGSLLRGSRGGDDSPAG